MVMSELCDLNTSRPDKYAYGRPFFPPRVGPEVLIIRSHSFITLAKVSSYWKREQRCGSLLANRSVLFRPGQATSVGQSFETLLLFRDSTRIIRLQGPPKHSHLATEPD